MADLQAAVATQLKNIQTKTGKSITELHAAVAASGASKHGEKRSWLMAHFKLGHGDANAVVNVIDKPLPDLGCAAPGVAPSAGAGGGSGAAAPEADPLDAIYSGAKAQLRPLHAHIMALVDGFGAHEKAPKKTYISLRRQKQFAMVGPATKEQIEIGLNHKALLSDTPDQVHPPRLKVLPAGGMCNYSLRVAHAAEVDAQVQAWLRAAFDAAG